MRKNFCQRSTPSPRPYFNVSHYTDKQETKPHFDRLQPKACSILDQSAISKEADHVRSPAIVECKTASIEGAEFAQLYFGSFSPKNDLQTDGGFPDAVGKEDRWSSRNSAGMDREQMDKASAPESKMSSYELSLRGLK